MSEARQIPHDLSAEAAILGSILLDNEQFLAVSTGIEASDLYSEQHRLIYRAMSALRAEGAPIDTVTLTGELRARGDLAKAGGAAYLVRLSAETPASIRAPHYCQIIARHARIRRVIAAAQTIAEDGLSADDAEAYCEGATALMTAATRGRSTNPARHLRQILGEAYTRIEDRYNHGGELPGLTTGYPDLDRVMQGLLPADFDVIAGRPSMGKTALALNIAARTARRGSNCAVFSLEMSAEQLAQRLIAMHGQVGVSALQSGRLTDSQWQTIAVSVAELSPYGIWIDDTPGLKIGDLANRARVLHREHKLDLLLIDYIQLMNGSAAMARRNREQEISEISRGLKALARELGIPVLAVSQLNRDVEGRPDKRPMLSDLRDSGSLEQDADRVLLLYRAAYYNRQADPAVADKAEVNIAKNRHGPTRMVTLRWDPTCVRFDSVEQ